MFEHCRKWKACTCGFAPSDLKEISCKISHFQVTHILEVKEIERRIKQGEELLMLILTYLWRGEDQSRAEAAQADPHFLRRDQDEDQVVEGASPANSHLLFTGRFRDQYQAEGLAKDREQRKWAANTLVRHVPCDTWDIGRHLVVRNLENNVLETMVHKRGYVDCRTAVYSFQPIRRAVTKISD